jgi:hypothetical protein
MARQCPNCGATLPRNTVKLIGSVVLGAIGALASITALFDLEAHKLDRRSTSAQIVNIETSDGHRAEVQVDCDVLDEDEELWLVVWKTTEDQDALWPVAGTSAEQLYSNRFWPTCDLWPSQFNVGDEAETGDFEIRLYKVNDDAADDWRQAQNLDDTLKPGALPSSDQLLGQPEPFTR